MSVRTHVATLLLLAATGVALSSCAVSQPPVDAEKGPKLSATESVVPGISEVMRVNTSSDLLFVSGQVAIDENGEIPSVFADELDLTFATLAKALDEAGSSMSDLVRVTIYVTDLNNRSLTEIREIRDKWVDPDLLPASTLVGVQALYSPDAHVEIDAVAVPAD